MKIILVFTVAIMLASISIPITYGETIGELMSEDFEIEEVSPEYDEEVVELLNRVSHEVNEDNSYKEVSDTYEEDNTYEEAHVDEYGYYEDSYYNYEDDYEGYQVNNYVRALNVEVFSNAPISVTNWEQLRNAVESTTGSSAASPRVITIANSFTATDQNTIFVPADQHVLIRSAASRNTITQSARMTRHFVLESGPSLQTRLTLENIVLDGGHDGINGVIGGGGIRANHGSHIVMNSGAMITNARAIVNITVGTHVSNSTEGGAITLNGGTYETHHNVDPNATSLTMNSGSLIQGNIQGGLNYEYGGPGGVLARTARVDIREGAELSYNRNTFHNGGAIAGILSSNITVSGLIQRNHGVSLGGGIAVSTNSTVTLDNAIIRNNTSSLGGGVGSFDGDIISTGNTQIYDNVGTEAGGGVFISSGSFISKSGNLRIVDNNAHAGGAISTQIAANVSLVNSLISGNTSTTNGGGINSITNSVVSLTDVEVYGNRANQGGGLNMSGSTLELINTTVDNNEAIGLGGGVTIIAGSQFDFDVDSTIVNNLGANGGALFVHGAGTTMTSRGRISHNNATQGAGAFVGLNSQFINFGEISHNSGSFGAGIMAQTGNIVINGGSISNNSVNSSGGGVSLTTQSHAVMNDGVVSLNTAPTGAGFNLGASSTFTMNGGTINNNTATSQGAGIQLLSGTVTIDGGTISGNTANFGGGLLVMNPESTMRILSGTISNNQANNAGGGAIVATNAQIIVEGGSFLENNASAGGGMSVQSSRAELRGGAITGNTSGQGAGVHMTNNAVVNVNGVNITNNVANTNGGGFLLDNTSRVEIANSTISGNSGVDGGGIFTSLGVNETPVPANSFANIDIANDVMFSGNTATGGTFEPPVNFNDLGNIRSRNASIHGHPLNNRDINFRGIPAIVSDCHFRVSTEQEFNEAALMPVATCPETRIELMNNITHTALLTINASRRVYVSSIPGERFSLLRGVTAQVRQITVSGGARLTLDNIIIDGGNNTTVGGGINATGTGSHIIMNDDVEIRNIYRGTPATNGAVLVSANATFTMNGGVIHSNQASGPSNAVTTGGAGVRVNNAIFIMNGGVIRNNRMTMSGTAPANPVDTLGGGGIRAYGANPRVTLNGGEIRNNTAIAHGGGIHIAPSMGVGDPVATNSFGGLVVSPNVIFDGNASRLEAFHPPSNVNQLTSINNTSASIDVNSPVNNADIGYRGVNRILICDFRVWNDAEFRFALSANVDCPVINVTLMDNIYMSTAILGINQGRTAHIRSNESERFSIYRGVSGVGRSITVSAGSNVTFTNVIIDGIEDNMPGGGLQVTGENSIITINNTIIQNVRRTTTSSVGAVIVQSGGRFVMNSGEIRNNFAATTVTATSGNGGAAIRIEAGTFEMNGGTISNNSSTHNNVNVNNGGGAIRGLSGATIILNDGVISDNFSAGNGGAIYVVDSNYNNPLSENSFPGLFVSPNVTFSYNVAQSGAFMPPNNALTATNINNTTSSLTVEHPLNNYDINFVGPNTYVPGGIQNSTISFFQADLSFSGETNFSNLQMLSGVTYSLEANGVEIAQSTSDSNGIVSFEDVPTYDLYTLRVISIPNGFALPSGYWQVRVEDGEISEITAYGDFIMNFRSFDVDGETVWAIGVMSLWVLPNTGAPGVNLVIALAIIATGWGIVIISNKVFKKS